MRVIRTSFISLVLGIDPILHPNKSTSADTSYITITDNLH